MSRKLGHGRETYRKEDAIGASVVEVENVSKIGCEVRDGTELGFE